MKAFIAKKITFLAPAQVFLSFSLLFGTWVIYIPTITEKLNMSKGQLGIALFFSAIGSLSASIFGKTVAHKVGEGKLTLYAILFQSLIVVGFFISPTFYFLCGTLFLFGISTGFLQVGMNSMVASIERKNNMAIMSACHGFFSLGGIISAGVGTILLIGLKNPVLHAILMSALVVILQFIFGKYYYSVKNEVFEAEHKIKSRNYKNLFLWGLALIGLIAMVSEGAIADWSGLFLRDVAHTNKNWLGLGYASFSLSMTTGRFIGDYFSKKLGSWQIIFGGMLTGLIGFSIILTGHNYLSIIGFFVVGAGFSIIIPEVYRTAANIEGVDPSGAISFMAGTASLGFLAGPVALGAIAESFGLMVSFSILWVLVAIGAIITMTIKARKRLKLA